MFEPDDEKYPKSWKEMSLDFRLFFVFHVCMIVLSTVGGVFPVEVLRGIVSVLLIVLTGLSIHHRMKSDWHWPGAGIKGVLGAVLIGALGLFFLGALQPTPPPVFAAAGWIIVFSILSSLKVVSQSESEFQSQCGDQRLNKAEPARTARTEAPWKKAVRAAFSVCFLAVWVAGVSFFWKFHTAFRHGTPQPTRERTETLTDHGTTVYITPEEKRIVSLLEGAAGIGTPSVLLLGALIHFVVGVKLLPNTPTLAEWKEKTSQPEK